MGRDDDHVTVELFRVFHDVPHGLADDDVILDIDSRAGRPRHDRRWVRIRRPVIMTGGDPLLRDDFTEESHASHLPGRVRGGRHDRVRRDFRRNGVFR